MDNHHPAGKTNNAITIPVPVNDHRADLSVAQQKWPGKTLANPDGNEQLAAAAGIRGFADTSLYLIEKLLLPVAEMLEKQEADRPTKPAKVRARKTKRDATR